MAKKKRKKPVAGSRASSRKKASQEDKMIKALDMKAQYQEFCNNILPDLRKDVEAKLSAEEIYKKYSHLAAARAITIVATEKDASKAVSLIKDILDRTGGKPAEKQETVHRLEKLPEEELDAILLTKLNESQSQKEKH